MEVAQLMLLLIAQSLIVLLVTTYQKGSKSLCSKDNGENEGGGRDSIQVTISVNVTKSLGKLDHFWESTGFCPPDPHSNASNWFRSPDMSQNLNYIASVPFDGIRYVRIHHMLYAVKAKLTSFGQDLDLNWDKLDSFIARLKERRLIPGFEVMGNPSGIFSDFGNETQVLLWKWLVAKTVNHFIEKFGYEYVKQWHFETWNEPKKNNFDGIKVSIQGWLNYYDATAHAIKDTWPNFIFGGPGGECHNYSSSSYCWALINHTVHGSDYFTGQKPLQLDFISIHKKGTPPNNTMSIVERERQFEESLHQHFPEIGGVSVYNDEADPQVTWSLPLWWRTDVTYAAMVAKNIIIHQAVKSSNYQLLSNDNGFLNYSPHFFTQRTLLARFQYNTTDSTSTQFIRKPIHSVQGLLSYLGFYWIDTKVMQGSNSFINALCSANTVSTDMSDEVSCLAVNSVDTNNITKSPSDVLIQFVSPPIENGSLTVVYKLDNIMTNPSLVWTEAGSPPTPSATLLEDMRKLEEPARILGPAPFQPVLRFQLPLPGIALVHICSYRDIQPAKVYIINLMQVQSGCLLITWKVESINASKCVKTYEVEYRNFNESLPFVRINTHDIIFTVFTFVSDTVEGWYRIRTVDYWGRHGSYSPVKTFIQNNPSLYL